MNGTVSTSLEQALADGASVAVVLDLADEAIEQASAAGDADTLGRLSRRLQAVATERGGEWKALAIAGARARALMNLATPDRDVAVEPPVPVPATPIEPVTTSRPSHVSSEGSAAATLSTASYAGWWIRALAYLLDLLLLGVAYVFLGAMPGGDSLLAGFVYFTLPLAYFAGMHAYADGATVGKLVVRVRVRTVDGGPVGLARAVGRALVTTGLWISSIGGLVDLIVLAADGRKQSVHDKAAGTVVQHVPRSLREIV